MAKSECAAQLKSFLRGVKSIALSAVAICRLPQYLVSTCEQMAYLQARYRLATELQLVVLETSRQKDLHLTLVV
jgi:hypothetical protein